MLVLGLSGASFPANAEPVTVPVVESAESAIVAPADAVLVNAEPVVTTEPAPEPVEVPVTLVEPVTYMVPVPVLVGVYTVPVEVPEPVTYTKPTTEGNGHVSNNGNPDCQVPGAIQYSDGSCTFQTVGNEISFAEPGTGRVDVPADDSTADTVPACGDLEMGEAWSGVGTHCGLGEDKADDSLPEDETVKVCGVVDPEPVLGSC